MSSAWTQAWSEGKNKPEDDFAVTLRARPHARRAHEPEGGASPYITAVPTIRVFVNT
jgi:hypothetical protein